MPKWLIRWLNRTIHDTPTSYTYYYTFLFEWLIFIFHFFCCFNGSCGLLLKIDREKKAEKKILPNTQTKPNQTKPKKTNQKDKRRKKLFTRPRIRSLSSHSFQQHFIILVLYYKNDKMALLLLLLNLWNVRLFATNSTSFKSGSSSNFNGSALTMECPVRQTTKEIIIILR